MQRGRLLSRTRMPAATEACGSGFQPAIQVLIAPSSRGWLARRGTAALAAAERPASAWDHRRPRGVPQLDINAVTAFPSG